MLLQLPAVGDMLRNMENGENMRKGDKGDESMKKACEMKRINRVGLFYLRKKAE